MPYRPAEAAMSTYDSEFPLLKQYGLYAAEIRGDGNCLFNALSDQLYGNQEQHHTIRARTIEHMRTYRDYYKTFVEVYSGGGTRRNPKRKTAGAYSSANAAAKATPEQVDRVFDEYLLRMSKGGSWGDNLEIAAFSYEFGVRIKIYQREFSYILAPRGNDPSTPLCHIAYHDWEHYSSIRNREGPYEGFPNVADIPMELGPEDMQKEAGILAQTPTVVPWMIDAVSTATNHTVDRDTIVKTLQTTNGSIDAAAEKLLVFDGYRSFSSQNSSSVERELESSDELAGTPKKRQDRRLSRTTKRTNRLEQQRRKEQVAQNIHSHGDSLESLLDATGSHAAIRFKSGSAVVVDSEDEFSTPPPLKDSDTSSGSEYSVPAASQPSSNVTVIKLRLTSKNNETASQPATKAPAKPTGVQKKNISARQMKDIKKQAQKAAAKERRQQQAGASPKKGKATPPAATSTTTNHPTVTTHMRTLII